MVDLLLRKVLASQAYTSGFNRDFAREFVPVVCAIEIPSSPPPPFFFSSSVFLPFPSFFFPFPSSDFFLLLSLLLVSFLFYSLFCYSACVISFVLLPPLFFCSFPCSCSSSSIVCIAIFSLFSFSSRLEVTLCG